MAFIFCHPLLIRSRHLSQAPQEALDLWPHLKPGMNFLNIHLASSLKIGEGLSQHKRGPCAEHTEENDGYIFILQTTEPTAYQRKLASHHPFQKGSFNKFRVTVQAIATKVKTSSTIE
jgi:hypothetical protein